LFYVIHKVLIAEGVLGKYQDQLEFLIWESFDCVKRSFVLIPKLQM